MGFCVDEGGSYVGRHQFEQADHSSAVPDGSARSPGCNPLSPAGGESPPLDRGTVRPSVPWVDERAGSLSWEAPPGLPNSGQVAPEAAIVKDSGTPRVVVGLREEIVDRNATLARLSWRAAFARCRRTGVGSWR